MIVVQTLRLCYPIRSSFLIRKHSVIYFISSSNTTGQLPGFESSVLLVTGVFGLDLTVNSRELEGEVHTHHYQNQRFHNQNFYHTVHTVVFDDHFKVGFLILLIGLHLLFGFAECVRLDELFSTRDLLS